MNATSNQTKPANETIVIRNELAMLGFLKSNGTACRFACIVTETSPKLKSPAHNPYKGAIKVSKKIGLVNVNYNESVARKIGAILDIPAESVDYVPGNVWYRHLTNDGGKALPIVVNKTKRDGKHYLQFFPQKSENAYVWPDGTPIAEEDIKPWLYESNREAFKPCVIAVDLANVKRLALSGVVMETMDFAEVQTALAAAE